MFQKEPDVRREVRRAAGGQDAVDAPAVIVFTAVLSRTAARYGDRAIRYVPIEVGHAAQNLLLEAVALGLGAVPVGAFSDADLHRVLWPSRQIGLCGISCRSGTSGSRCAAIWEQIRKLMLEGAGATVVLPQCRVDGRSRNAGHWNVRPRQANEDHACPYG